MAAPTDRPAAPAAGAAPGPGRLERWLAGVWWRPAPTAAATLLRSLSWLYRAAAALARRRAAAAVPTPVPVIVVGNLVVGGAGKTPIVIALVEALRAAGRRPAVISRGHGRSARSARHAGDADITAVTPTSSADEAGDEPLLIARRTGVPVFVGRRRAAVARALCDAHPQVDVIVSDDGLQHHALARVAEVVVFDDRGAGNGLLLPAGPLREPLPAAVAGSMFVVYSGQRASTPLPGVLARRSASRVVPLDAWATGSTASTTTGAQPLSSLRGRRVAALAGIGAPEQFFAMLEAAGLEIERLPARDHARYAQAPWTSETREVVTTEKDAVKLAALPASALHGARVWVVPLDCELPDALVHALVALLALPARSPPREETSR